MAEQAYNSLVPEKDPAIVLTTKEREIMNLLGQGKTSKEIAAALKLKPATIASHRKNLCRKLNVHSTAELIHHASAWRIRAARLLT
jgi:DNA-binding CsgD family transcriptional regulator